VLVSTGSITSLHVHNAPDAVSRSHCAQPIVHLIQRLAVCDELVNLQLSIGVILHQPAHLRTAFDTTESTSPPHAAGHEL
jgi:hypothetical protein